MDKHIYSNWDQHGTCCLKLAKGGFYSERAGEFVISPNFSQLHKKEIKLNCSMQ